MIKKIKESELILNPDGSVYHLKLRPENIAGDIIVVGDQGRVSSISKYFDKIEFSVQNREFLTHTGTIGKKRITALSTGIGTDNIDIVINELDALVNIDLNKRTVKDKHTALNIIRLGTSGALQKDIPVDSCVLSTHGLGFDGLLNFYDTSGLVMDEKLIKAFIKHTGWNSRLPRPYLVPCSEELGKSLGEGFVKGITATASGFYGPQGRELRLKPAMPDLNESIGSFEFKGQRITNFEMETSALYGLGALLGHRTLTICAIVANRVIMQFSKDYKKTVDGLIRKVLERLP
jgi:uridine phosphorylase